MIYSSDESFLTSHELSSENIIKVFARVKERIKPDLCATKTTGSVLEIIFVKENPNSMKWGRLEPSEYSEYCALKPPSSPSTPPPSPMSTPSVHLHSSQNNDNSKGTQTCFLCM
jgi:hypothetical protein